MITPRFYQIRAIDLVTQRFKDGIMRQILAIATGLGKTVCFSLLAKKMNVRTLIIAHREELLEQAADKLRLVWPSAEIGILKAERNEISAQVVIASIQSACRPNRLEELKNQGFQLCVVDEAHHSTSESYRSVLNELGFLNDDPAKLLLGVTATARRADGTGLDEVFQEISFSMGIKEGIDQGYLSPLLGKQILSHVNLKGISTSCGDFVASELSRAVNIPERNALIVKAFQEHAGDRKKALAFAVDVQHAIDLASAFQNAGIDSKAVYGAMDGEGRKKTLKDFSEGRIRVLTNCSILTEGFDEPAIDCLLLCRPTQSEGLYVQMVGRSARPHPAKQNSLVLDFVDNSSRHRLASFTSLEGAIKVIRDPKDPTLEPREEKHEEEQEEVEIEYAGHREINFFEERQFAWVKIGENWQLRASVDTTIWVNRSIDDDLFDVVIIQRGEKTNLSELPLPLLYATGLAEDFLRKQEKPQFARKDAPWRSKPASEKQLQALTKCGILFDTGITMGKAAELLDAKFNEPATPKQTAWLRSHGVEFPSGITKNQARKLIAEKLK